MLLRHAGTSGNVPLLFFPINMIIHRFLLPKVINMTVFRGKITYNVMFFTIFHHM